jgi:hypothetical protein
MSDKRKKSVWPWIVALLVGLSALYVASFGPACWISSRTDSGAKIVDRVYQPLMRLWWRGAIPSERDLLQRYALLYASNTKWWGIGVDRANGQYRWEGGY